MNSSAGSLTRPSIPRRAESPRRARRPKDRDPLEFISLCLVGSLCFISVSMLTEETITNALKAVKYPGYSRDIVSFGLVKSVAAKQGAVSVMLQLTSGNSQIAEQLKADCERTLKSLPEVKLAHVEVKLPSSPPGSAGAPSPWANQGKVPGINRMVAVASGKGGVGKSTCSVNLACAFQRLGARVGLLDCDIYGPSIPLMMGIRQRPTISAQEKMVPPSNHGVKLMSMGFLLDGDQPVIWRGPMIMKTIQQFFNSVEWGELDFLLVDLPPGTGDAQLSLCQTVPLHGGGHAEAQRQNVAFLGEVPLFQEIREGGDRGIPIVVSAPASPAGEVFIRVAETLRQQLP